MAPARSNRRTHQEQPVQLRNTPSDTNAANKTDLFLEPMMGTPLTVYIEKDVEEKESLVELIAKHGGAVSPGYSGTPYILEHLSRPPQRIWPESLSPVCRKEREGRTSLQMDPRVYPRGGTADVPKQLGRLQSHRHREA
ncbi:hypothetical protein EDD17DRAFT_963655 [Pisolithus thermaeus]|nr:hypothetical protein EDD17DRAFT_963655 [Pisolithus thermaeus]